MNFLMKLFWQVLYRQKRVLVLLSVLKHLKGIFWCNPRETSTEDRKAESFQVFNPTEVFTIDNEFILEYVWIIRLDYSLSCDNDIVM